MSGSVLLKFLARIRMGTWSRCTTLTWIHSIHLQQVDALLQPETSSFNPVTTPSSVVNRPSTPTFLRREAAGDYLGSASTY
ncbi:hypothetical protein Bca4012_065821 [Brassica carinata]|uniref:Uncharacterized protein n=1 Tax=Brassica carinata TaxID=52824 RepID=A0A8X7VNC6_BRACI|nr:hypothetical protein Bca52824_018140 [Brassica carinata]